MKHPRHYTLTIGLLGICLVVAFSPVVAAPAAPAPAPVPTDDVLKQMVLFNGEATKAFLFGDFKKAIENLDKVIALAPPQFPMETVHYTLGAAYFNSEQYPVAVEKLKDYLTRYPKGPHVVDATYSMAQAAYLAKDYAEAAADYRRLEAFPKFREQAMLYGGMASKEAGQIDDAIATFKKLISPEIRTSNSANGGILLASLYIQKAESAKAIEVLQELCKKAALLDNVTRLNSLAVELGDGLLRLEKPKEALDSYKVVRSREEVIQFQSERITALQKAIEQNLAAFRTNPAEVVILTVNKQLRAGVDVGTKLLDEFKKLPDFRPGLLLRTATCLFQMDKKWESVVVFEDLLRDYPADASREAALYGLILASNDTNRFARAEKLCETYLAEFKTGKNAETVGLLLGTAALQTKDAKGAETYFGRVMQEQPESSYKEELHFQFANSKFAQGKFDDASRDYEKYLADFPSGTHTEDAVYHIALCSAFGGKYEQAMRQIAEYMAKYPQGEAIPDAKYRIAVCKYAASLYDEVIADCKAWQAEFPKGTMLGEVLSLQGDAFGAKLDDDKALTAYTASVKEANADDVLEYSLNAAQKLFQKHGNWNGMAAFYQDFVKRRPDHSMVPMAFFWIAKAMTHEGKTEEAKKFLASTIKANLADPGYESEPLLTQLAQLCIRKKASAALATPTPSARQEVYADPAVELDALLADSGKDQSPTAQARIIYSKAELARLRKKPTEVEKAFRELSEKFKPEDFGAVLLAQVGDFLMEKKMSEKAALLFQRLMDEYPRSPMVDFAYNGLGSMALDSKDFDRAYRFFNDGIERIDEGQKRRDMTIGRAQALVALKRLDEAKKGFEQVASKREWRGECTALSIFSLGEIARAQNYLPDAITFYQRVFVGYQRFLPWVAKAYLASGDCFEKLGKRPEAVATYREMLRNRKLSDLTESHVAKNRLQELGEEL